MDPTQTPQKSGFFAAVLLSALGVVVIAVLVTRSTPTPPVVQPVQSVPPAQQPVQQYAPPNQMTPAGVQQPQKTSPAPSALEATPPKGMDPLKVGDLVFSFSEGCHIEASTIVCIGAVENLGDPGTFQFRNDTATRGLAYLGGENMPFTDAFFLPHGFTVTLNKGKPMRFRIAFPDNSKGATTTDLVLSLDWRNDDDQGITIPGVPVNR